MLGAIRSRGSASLNHCGVTFPAGGLVGSMTSIGSSHERPGEGKTKLWKLHTAGFTIIVSARQIL